MRHVIGLTMLAALVVAGCGSGEPSGAAAPKAEISRILDAVQAAVPGERAGEITWYEPESLYEYINGDAGRFVDAGFVWLAHTEWRPKEGAGKAYVEMDLYDLGTPLGALDIFDDSRGDQVKYLAIGNEAMGADDLLELRVGRYYVKLTPRFDAAALKPLVQALAEAVAKAAPLGPGDEQLLAPLPFDRMVPHAAAYISKGFLGRDFLSKIREATYEVQGKRVRLFVMDAGSEENAKALLAEWKESIPPRPIGTQDLPNQLSYSDEYVGGIAAACRGKWLAGAIGDPAAAQPVLDSFLKRLE